MPGPWRPAAGRASRRKPVRNPQSRNWLCFAHFIPRPSLAPYGNRLCLHAPIHPSLGLFCTFTLRPGQIGFVLYALPLGRLGVPARHLPRWPRLALFCAFCLRRPPTAGVSQSAIEKLASFCTYCDKRHKKNSSQSSRNALGPRVLTSRLDSSDPDDPILWLGSAKRPALAALLYIDAC
jgi:hypothetical protein